MSQKVVVEINHDPRPTDIPPIWCWRQSWTDSRRDDVGSVTSKSQGVGSVEHETSDYRNQHRSLGYRSRDLSETCAFGPVERSVSVTGAHGGEWRLISSLSWRLWPLRISYGSRRIISCHVVVKSVFRGGMMGLVTCLWEKGIWMERMRGSHARRARRKYEAMSDKRT